MEAKELPATGERLLPSMSGLVVLEHLHRYAIAATLVEGRDVLDIASGEGYGSRLLAVHARSVVGVDISPEAIGYARAAYEQPNLSFREGSCTSIPLPDASVDLVVSFETIEHIREHEQFLAEILRVLRKGGQVLISTPECAGYNAILAAANPYHLRELSRAEFEALLRGHFAHVSLLGQRASSASVVFGMDGGEPQRQGIFTGDFELAEFSEKSPGPTYLLALCSDAPLPAVPVGAFEFKHGRAYDLFRLEACCIQVFGEQGAGYSEERSLKHPLTPDVWQPIKFGHIEALHTDFSRRLRIDLESPPALLEVASIRITRDADGSILYEASTAQEFRQIDCSPHILPFSEGGHLVLLTLDGDPQFFLPLLPDFQGAACTLELHVRLEALVPGVVHRMHEARAALAAARSRLDSWSEEDRQIMDEIRPWFDREYYLANNPDVARSGMDPLEHYHFFGEHDGRRPCPDFDPTYYLVSYADVRLEGFRPFHHFVMRGKAEGRSGQGFLEPYSIRQVSRPPDLPQGSIGVALHLFYPDIWEKIKGVLARFPEQMRLYVSLVEGHSEHLREIIERDHPSARIQIVRNRGRDVAPFLEQLRAMQEDGVMAALKIHGKKSLANIPGFGEAWRDSLYEDLAPTVGHLNAIIRLFQSDPHVGVLIPEAHYESLLRLLDHNRTELGRLMGGLGVALSDEQMRTTPFPAGTMFWFRPAALRGLSRLNLQTGDFPEEAGQIDGTLAHAIERLISVAASAEGYKTLAYRWRTVESSSGTAATIDANGSSVRVRVEKKHPALSHAVGVSDTKDLALSDRSAAVTPAMEYARPRTRSLFQELNPDIVYAGYIAGLEFAAGMHRQYDIRFSLVVHPCLNSQSVRQESQGNSGGASAPVARINGKELILFAAAPGPQLSLLPPGEVGADSCTMEITLKLATGEEGLLPGISQLIATQQAMLASETEAAASAREAALRAKESAIRMKDAAALETEAAARTQEDAIREKEAAAWAQRDALREKEAAVRAQEDAVREKEAALRAQENAVREIPALRGAIASAEAWQKRSWLKRAFHRWRSPLTNARRLNFFERLNRSFLSLGRRFIGEIVRFLMRWGNSLLKRFVAVREMVIRLAVRSRLTRRLRKLDNDAKILHQGRLVDGEWYCNKYRMARLRPCDAVIHYLRIGAHRGWNPNLLFHTGWYLASNPDVLAANQNPAVHYAKEGWREGRQPHPEFCIRSYLEANPDVREMEKEPLAHYLWDGIREGRKLAPPPPAEELPEPRDPFFDPPAPFLKEPQDFTDWPEPDVRLLAFYLPQFHRIPENDAWWGDGFTEWTNVRRALPQAEGHYQPHVPHADVGYYDLFDPAVMERQVAMARTFGIHGFCFYSYWFAGRRLLEMPVQRLLATGRPDFPFCLCWANENWTRRWDGMDDDILIAQEHRPEDDEQFIRDIIPALRDRRYIRTGGRPLLLIYRPLLLREPVFVFRRWREICRAEGVGEIHLAGVLGGGFADPRAVGLDSAVEFPPNSTGYHPLKTGARGLHPHSTAVLCDYLETRKNALARTDSDFRVFHTVMPAWDNTARRKEGGTIYVKSSPSHYFSWLRLTAEKARQRDHSGERIAFVNAWNEWAEGCHIEPDTKYGYQWLNATRNALLPASSQLGAPVVVIGHDAERAGAQHVLLALLREWKRTRPFPFCLILSAGGALRSQFEDCCPTLVLSDYPDADDRQTALDRFLIIRPRLYYSNTVVNGPLLKELHRFGVPVVTHVHELQKSIERWAPGLIFEATLEYTDHFIAVSTPVLANLRDRHRVAPEAITVIHEFIDTEYPPLEAEALAEIRSTLGATPEDLIVFGCGTTDWRKGPDLFVQIAAACANEPRLRFVWIGASTPEEQAALDAEIERQGLSERVRFLGPQSEPRRFLPAGDIFLLPSREDPFPLVALEAADAGLPVVCFAEAGGIPDFVESDCGFVVPLGDTAAAAAAIQRLASDGALRERLGSQARDKVRREHPTHAAAARIAKLVTELAERENRIKPSPNVRPLVSVIVPNYNHAPFLASRLKSILAQGIEDMEILILDDASTDESRELLKEFAFTHPGTRLVFNDKNSGSTFKQWRKGLRMARGHFVWIAESDDSAESGLLASLVRKLQRHPDAVLAYAQSRMIDKSERDLGLALEWTADLSPTRWLSDFTAPGDEEIRTALSCKNSIPNASAVLFRNFDGIEDLVDDSMRLCADWLFWTRLCKRGGVAFDSRPLNRWRQRTSHARTRPPGELEWIEGVRVVEECAETLGLPEHEREKWLSTFRSRCDLWRKSAAQTSIIKHQ